jgi:predicted lipoprotein
MPYIWIAFVAFFLTACASENSAQERNATNFSEKTSTVQNLTTFDKTTMLQNILDNVLLADVSLLKSETEALSISIKNLQNTPTNIALSEAQNAWKVTMETWKRVQANYVEDEIFLSNGIDEIRNLLDLSDFVNPSKKKPSFYAGELLNSGDDVASMRLSARERTYLVLESLLFDVSDETDYKDNSRRAELAVKISELLLDAVIELESYWQNDERFISNIDGESMDNILNKMIDNVYKSRETRLGDPAGLTQASGAVVDPLLVESLPSQTSKEHIINRILGLEKLYLGGEGLGFDDYLISKGLIKENNALKIQITDSIRALSAISGSLKSAITEDPEAVKVAFDSLGELLTAVQITLPAAIDLVPKIVEADGD